MTNEIQNAMEIALCFLHSFWDSDIDGALDQCEQGATFQFARSLPYAWEVGIREALETIRDDMFDAFDQEGFNIELHHKVADANEVMVEYSAHGQTRNGHPYDNDYVMCISVREGKVTSVRPHTDTLHLTQLLIATVGDEKQ